MDWLSGIDWTGIFGLHTPVLELFVRGTLMYLGIFVLLRTLLRREAGMVSLPDLLLIVLLADAAQNGLADDYRSVTDGVLLIGVIIGWNVVLDRLAYRFAVFERFVHPPPLPLVREGRLLHANLRREFITREELWSQLRAQGIEELSQVKAAHIEANGNITVIKRSNDEQARAPHRRPV